MTFEPAQAPGESRQRRKVIGSEDLALDDGEVEFELIEPAGVDGTTNQAQVRMMPLQALNRSRTAVAGAVVDNPKDPMGVTVRSLGHDLLDQAVEGDNRAAGFAAAIDLGSVDLPGSQIGSGPEATVLMLDLEKRVSPGRQRGGNAGGLEWRLSHRRTRRTHLDAGADLPTHIGRDRAGSGHMAPRPGSGPHAPEPPRSLPGDDLSSTAQSRKVEQSPCGTAGK